jgi:hypothetical protein
MSKTPNRLYLYWKCRHCDAEGSSPISAAYPEHNARSRLRHSHANHSYLCQKNNGISGVTYRPVMAACKYGTAEGKSDA